MFAKLVLVILSLGATACLLLSARQMRLQAVHELADTHQRIEQHDRVIADMRVELAGSLSIEHIRELSKLFDKLAPRSPRRSPLPEGTIDGDRNPNRNQVNMTPLDHVDSFGG